MRGIASISLPLVILLSICILSRSASASGQISVHTARRVAGRLVEESQRALAQRDRSPVNDLVNIVTARTWAQASLALASEDAVRSATGVDPHQLVDRAQRRIDRTVRTLNDRLPHKHRVRVDDVLVSRT